MDWEFRTPVGQILDCNVCCLGLATAAAAAEGCHRDFEVGWENKILASRENEGLCKAPCLVQPYSAA